MIAATMFRHGGAGLRRQMTSGAMRRCSTTSAAEASPPVLDNGSLYVIGACYFGAFLWYYRDSLESDGTMVQVPKKKLDNLQKEIDAIKKLMK
mmetsp:Transcript_4195/g.10812  ORF Transcript_4195/g.10812 Transcript_4195/m.10812 type:complete len:93 (-) Transcript_4195:400-678(-)